MTRPDGLNRACAGFPGFDDVAAVHLNDLQVRERRQQFADRAAGRVDLNGHANGVTVVLDHVEHRQLEVAGGVHGLPELALTGGAVTRGHKDDLVGVPDDLAVAERVDGLDDGGHLCGASGVQELGAGARRHAGDIELLAAPVAGHLPTVRVRVVFGADAFEQNLVGGHADREHQSAVAIIREEPVVARLHLQAGADEGQFVSCARDLKEDLVLPFQFNLSVVDATREVK